MLIDLCAPSKTTDRGIAVGQSQLAAVLHHDVVPEFVAQVLIELDRVAVKFDASFSQIIRSNDRSVARGIPPSEITLVNQCDIRNAMFLREVIGNAAAVSPGANNDDVVMGFQRFCRRKMMRTWIVLTQTLF